ncbi:Bacterial regulatory protein, tetR family [compost metagenome]
MDFIRARTPDQINSRQEEIINACDTLFTTYGYEGVTFKAISDITTFTRPSIYNYYKTKDEILLGLLGREMQGWQASFMEVMSSESRMSKEQYSAFLTKTLISREKMLKLLSILFSVLETNSRVEKYADFKRVSNVLDIIGASLDKYFPEASTEAKTIFLSAFSAYILGLYPISHHTQKQLDAGQMAGIEHVVHVVPDLEYLCYHGILLLLSGL